MRSRQLQQAKGIHETYRVMNRKGKRSAIEKLASFGFSSKHIAAITGVSIKNIEIVVNPEHYVGGVRGWFDNFNPDTLDAIYLLVYNFEESGEVNQKLVRNILKWGTGLHALSYISGLGEARIREVALGS